MELEGKISSVLASRGGVSQRTGNSWKSQDFVLEFRWYANQMEASHMVFTVFGEERLQKWDFQVGDEVRLKFTIDAHQYEGRWFNEIRAFDVTFINSSAYKDPKIKEKMAEEEAKKKEGAAAPAAAIPPQFAPAPEQAPAPQGEGDDLPF